MEEFSDFINDHFLIDLPLSGERFTWARAEDSNSRWMQREGVRAPFRFENMWLKVSGIGNKVKEWWTSYRISWTPSFRLLKKLKLLKGDIIRWNKEVFGREEVKMRELMHELGELERGEGAKELHESEKAKLGEVKREIVELVIAQEDSWRQKLRALWLNEGDSNTKFFHRVAVVNRRRNFIESLVVDGVRIERE
ncbi:uncharacterized protein LOC142176157 [Nicotiana tabacum]|uniref:Uncharacterized protein LOC142176157 n=1 Tax=Nicotiana tabacum TaxID=4097 RepID=A0AC58TQ42_TOBAC